MTRSYGNLIASAILLLTCAGCTDHFHEGLVAYRKGNFGLAMKELMPLAKRGDAMAQLYVGIMYDKGGEGIPVNYGQAVLWYAKAADQANPIAQHNLGVMYGRGLGVQQDWILALKWFNLAVITSNGRSTQAINDGKFAASRMTTAQIKEAERLADQWLSKNNYLRTAITKDGVSDVNLNILNLT